MARGRLACVAWRGRGMASPASPSLAPLSVSSLLAGSYLAFGTAGFSCNICTLPGFSMLNMSVLLMFPQFSPAGVGVADQVHVCLLQKLNALWASCYGTDFHYCQVRPLFLCQHPFDGGLFLSWEGCFCQAAFEQSPSFSIPPPPPTPNPKPKPLQNAS